MSKKKAPNPKGNPAITDFKSRGNRTPWNSESMRDLKAALNDPGVLIDKSGKPMGISPRQKAVETLGLAMDARDKNGHPNEVAVRAAEIVINYTDNKPQPGALAGAGPVAIQIIVTRDAGPNTPAEIQPTAKAV